MSSNGLGVTERSEGEKKPAGTVPNTTGLENP